MALLLAVISSIPILCSSYSLKTELNSTTFFDGTYWNFYTGNDPTHGFVNYVDKSTAQQKGYINSNQDGRVYIGCDHTNIASGRGRDSVRLSSKQAYNNGLFMLYLEHMPTGCGTWPAWWSFGPNWPNSGEIDIIEGVDVRTKDQSTLHTNPGCDFSSAPKNFTGNQVSTNCYSASDEGCGIVNDNPYSYGAALNSKNGGLFVMDWNEKEIAMWMWNEGDIPANAKSTTPNPASWGMPYARWVFGNWCPSSHFVNHNIIFDLTFCGDWDGAVFSGDCPNDGSCTDFVRNNPSAFTEAYWGIHWMRVFQ